MFARELGVGCARARAHVDPDVLVSDVACRTKTLHAHRPRPRAPRNQGARTPAVALTAYSRVEDRVDAFAAAFNYTSQSRSIRVSL